MKHFIYKTLSSMSLTAWGLTFALLLAFCSAAKADNKQKADSVYLNAQGAAKVELIADTCGLTPKGNLSIKYYALLNGELYISTKATFEYMKVCKRLHATPKLVIINKKKIVKL